MSAQSVLLQVQQALPSLPEQEFRVGDYVLRHPHETVTLSITDLARACGVSNTTVSRFCRRIGLDGYRPFRIALARESGSAENLTYVEVTPEDTLALVARKVFAANVQTLQQTERLLDVRVLAAVVEALLRAGRVDIYATGGAAVAAQELHFKCLQLGLNASAFQDSQMQAMSAATLSSGDVGIGISHSGMQWQVVQALEKVHSSGGTTVAMTSYPDSPLARAAGLVLCTAPPNAAILYAPPAIRNAQLALVDVLYEAMLMRGKEPARAKMERVAQAISEHLTGPRPSRARS
ncbi:MAG TPA: MurR/RpiR family transcriptional regulator [Anaerolineae bacterium]|nr:MurR/RpiR family transcriptional regulator [Anaerolineae bacterium]